VQSPRGVLRGLLAAGVLALSASLAAGEIFDHTDAATGTRILVLKQGSTVARFAPSKGANVFSIEVEGIEYLRQPDDMYRFSDPFRGTPILYPTPNRVRGATFRYAGRAFAFTPNLGRDHIHGLIVDQPWRVLDTVSTESSAFVRCEIAFAPGTELYRQFPLAHRLLLTVTVTDGAVRWAYEVDNRVGEEPVPYGFGLHPFFVYQGARSDTFATLPATHRMDATDGFPSGRLIPASELDYPLGGPIAIGARTFDDVFWGLRPGARAIIDFRGRNRAIEITASEEFSHVVLWVEDSDVFSVEHQTSSTDAHNLHAAGLADEASLEICPAGAACGGWVEYRFTASGSYDWLWEDANFLRTREHCESCHGILFTGARAPGLLNRPWRHAESTEDLVRVIGDGIPGTAMPAFRGVLSDEQVTEMAGFMTRVLKEIPGEELQSAWDITAAGARQTFLETFTLETVIEGLDTPWSFAFLPAGGIILNEHPGRVRLFADGVLSDPVRGTPVVAWRQDAGLLALAPHPDYPENGWIYLAYADPGADPDTSTTRIVRGRIRDQAWVDEESIWRAPPALYSADNSHFGTRLVFGGDHLFFSIGDRGRRDDAQDLSSPYGKIHRLHADGSVPPDNPFVGTAGALASVWSYGHRNPQGLAVSPSGTLWSSEHGPRGGDELNRIVRGGNYGWPLATHGTEFDGTAISEATSLPGMIDPALLWRETIAPSGIAFYRGAGFPAWQGSLLVTSLAAKELRRVAFDRDAVSAQELLLKGAGRLRDVQIGPEGNPYLAAERSPGTGVILRLVPVPPSADASD